MQAQQAYIINAISARYDKCSSQIGMQFQRDIGRHCTEFSYTTDDGLLGLRGLYNFGHDRFANGQWSAGAELYYGILDKSGGCKYPAIVGDINLNPSC
jgi:distribution and morphology protein 10